VSAKIERPRGTHDVVPAEMPLWRHVTGEVERLCALYGYRKVLTPVFEDTALFSRTSGAGSDVVQKEMYSFTDRSDRPLTLRPEGTAPICRAYVEHGMHREPQPLKMFTIAPMYRYGAPGRGRYREHWQASVEAIGTADPAIDAELIQLYDTLLARLGVSAYHLELNSIGCRECRPAYLTALRSWLVGNEERLDADTRAKTATSPLRVFDNYLAKPEAVRAALDEAPKIGESLCEACVEHFAAVRADLDATGVAYTLVPTLVRGLDYYTRTVFEVTAQGLGAQDALLGGGRYDRLVSDLGGPKTPGIGFAIGEDRLVDVLPEAFRSAAIEAFAPVALVVIEPSDRAAALALAADLRNAGVAVDLDPAGKGPGAGLKAASKRGCRMAVLLGQKERESGVAIVKDLVERSQKEVPLADLPSVLKGETP
jgi:histidyl-tRNA synthetase